MRYPRRALISALLLILSVFAFPSQTTAQEKNTTFVHGIFGDQTSWQEAENELEPDFPINPLRFKYSSDKPIPTIAEDNYGVIQDDAVVVAHSMGGLVSRSMVKKFGTSKFDALITSGTPHIGTRTAVAVQQGQGVTEALIDHWSNDLALGWYALGGFDVGDAIADQILGDFANWVGFQFEQKFNVPSADDMRPGDQFINNLNANFSSSVPDATYAVTGLEDWNAHWRLFSSFKSSDEKEGNIMTIVNTAKYFYLAASYYTGYIANKYLYLYNKTGSWIYYDLYLQFSSASQGFFVGFDSLNRQQQLEWAWNVTGAWDGPGSDFWYSDGIVPTYSHVPAPLRQENRGLNAFHANHLELRVRGNAIDRIADAFNKSDVDVPEPNQAPVASFTWTTSGLTADFSNESFDPDGSIVSYEWAFGDGSTSTSANPSHTYSTDGFYLVTLTVTDDEGATASMTNTINVSSSGDCGLLALPPCP